MNNITNRYIEGLLAGDETVIKEIYAKLYPKIKRYVISARGNEDDALDVFHDALMYFMTQKGKTSEILSFEPYFFTVSKNLWKKTLNSKVIKKEVTTLIDKETNLSLFVLEQNCFDLYIEKFNKLSLNCKEVLNLYFNGLSYDDIVKEKDYASINTVRQRVFKCRSKLIKLIKADAQYQKIKRWR
ncbi:sigma-70 family RNA polymerase sigma factor [uncultured Lacinutrix sp.]|uniref:RNA polymerase sigma factor n=1 Tax=uncultured Lacinutrix sp. TaxID=574032 RepID=UPI00260857AF|nr:sigma-70 family RNA polymerase sigma factor [uncultured Lacinutrix sp.]